MKVGELILHLFAVNDLDKEVILAEGYGFAPVEHITPEAYYYEGDVYNIDEELENISDEAVSVVVLWG